MICLSLHGHQELIGISNELVLRSLSVLILISHQRNFTWFSFRGCSDKVWLWNLVYSISPLPSEPYMGQLRFLYSSLAKHLFLCRKKPRTEGTSCFWGQLGDYLKQISDNMREKCTHCILLPFTTALLLCVQKSNATILSSVCMKQGDVIPVMFV